MNNSTVYLTTMTESTNFTTNSIGAQHISETCLHSISFLVGLPTHCYVTWLIITGTGNGIASEFFHLNLSISETFNCFNHLVIAASFWVSYLTAFKLFLTGLTITGRPLFQCLICFDRYLAVAHPVIFLKLKPLRYRVICCTVVWTITLFSCLICMLATSSNMMLLVWLTSFNFIFIISIQLFYLVSVLKALKQSVPGERKREEENHMRKKAFYHILITTVNMLITYVPLCLTGLYSILSNLFIQTVWFPSVICYILAGFIQPLLFLRRTGKLPCLCSRFSSNSRSEI